MAFIQLHLQQKAYHQKENQKFSVAITLGIPLIERNYKESNWDGLLLTAIEKNGIGNSPI